MVEKKPNKKTKRWTLILLFLGLPTLAYWVTLAYVDHQLSKRQSQPVYSSCFKIWATRGLVTQGDVTKPSAGNSPESLNLAFTSGAKGSEIDLFFDVGMNDFIISHDFPYNLKNGKLLTLTELLQSIGSNYAIWLDLKKLGRLTKDQAVQAAQKLRGIARSTGMLEKLYVEGEDPINLGAFRDAGIKTLLDTQPLKESMFASSFVLGIYKMAYYFGDFTVMGMNAGSLDDPIFGKKAEQLLKDIPLFIYHVPDDVNRLQSLSDLSNVKVILNTDHSVNRYALNSCSN